jgi:deazaflavin-dependent oxidoreductase (nitroreductase family)
MAQGYLSPRGRLLNWITRTHVSLYRKTGGFIGMAMPAPDEGFRRLDCLLLTTTGRKTAKQRTVVLPFFQYDGRIVLVGSNAAQKNNSAWYHNVKADPRIAVEIGALRLNARAVILEGDDYDNLWERHKNLWPRWAAYDRQVERRIPLVEIRLES